MKNVELKLHFLKLEGIEWAYRISCSSSHIWFMKSLPVELLLLDMTIKNLEKVLYFEQFIVVEPGLTDLKKGE